MKIKMKASGLGRIIIPIVFILLLFLNSLTAFASEDKSVSAVIHIEEILTKENTNKDEVENTFHFILAAADADCPLPSDSENGQFAFSLKSNNSTDIELTFTKAGTYVYSLYEAEPDIKEGFVCDESKYTLVIYALNAEDGGLIAAVSAIKEDDKVGSIVFKDVFTGTQDPSSNDAKETESNTTKTAAAAVKTGDISDAMLWGMVSVFAFSFIVICIILLKKSRSDNGVRQL